MKKLVFALCVTLLLGISGHAAVIGWDANLSGAQEDPPNASPGAGTGSGTFDTLTGALTWTVTYADLTGPLTGAHFHLGAPGVSGPVKVPMTLGSSPLVGSGTVPAEDIDDFLAGDYYVNLHTELYPRGEIRGQVHPGGPIPEPSTLLMLSGALIAGGYRLRRKSG